MNEIKNENFHLKVINENNIEKLPIIEKKHTSYSELITWIDCSWKHKLKYKDLINLSKGSEHTEFGHEVHAALDTFLKTKVMPPSEEVVVKFQEAIDKLGIEVEHKDFHDVIDPILKEVPIFLEEKFKGWEFVASEQSLYEEAGVQEDRYFKGFIDGIIKVPKSSRLKRAKPDEFEYWILDWKTCAWGWDMKKKTDPKKTMQLAFYKHFFSKKFSIDIKDIRCGFVLLKRTPSKKSTERCELVPVSVGEKSIQNALDNLGNMLGSFKKKLYQKNRNSCTYCEYKGTVHCP